MALAVSLMLAGCSQSADKSRGTGLGLGPTPTLSPRATVALPGNATKLKASAPVITSPADGSSVSGALTVTMTNARTLFVPATVQLEVQMWEISGSTAQLISTDVVEHTASGPTSHKPSGARKAQTDYELRARAVLNGSVGPWSTVVMFRNLTASGGIFTPGSTGDQINPFDVVYLHRNIATWDQISTITDIIIGSREICVFHTGAGRFPQSDFGDIVIEGNIWVFAPIGGRWFGATWDWLRPGQQCKGESLDTLGDEQIRIPPMDGSWRPAQGTPICFAISSRARDEVQAGEVRSNIACTTVP